MYSVTKHDVYIRYNFSLTSFISIFSLLWTKIKVFISVCLLYAILIPDSRNTLARRDNCYNTMQVYMYSVMRPESSNSAVREVQRRRSLLGKGSVIQNLE
jgi:hypothetical protein